MSNNTTGFWVILALIAALSFVAIVEVAIAIVRSLARKATNTVRSRRLATAVLRKS